MFSDTVDCPFSIKYTELDSILSNQKVSEGVQEHLTELLFLTLPETVHYLNLMFSKILGVNISQNLLH